MIPLPLLLTIIASFFLGLAISLAAKNVARNLTVAAVFLMIFSVVFSFTPLPEVAVEVTPWLVDVKNFLSSILPYALIAFVAGLVAGLLRE